MSISSNFPNVRPSLLLDFANTQALDPRVTFSRSTTAPYYDGKTSVLAEQNLALQSQTASFISGSQTGLTITGNTTVAPDGTTTGTTVAFAATTSYGYQAASTGQILGATYTFSVWVWSTTGKGLISVRMANNSNGSDGTFTSVSLTSTATRISITRTFTNSGTAIDIGFDNRTGQGGDGIAGSIVYWGAQLEQRSSVTAYNATTTTALTNYIPQLLTAPINSPRFDYNPTTGESLGLLIEQSSTNTILYSEQFDNANWTALRASVTPNSNVSPDGNLTADLILDNSTSGTHVLIQTISKTASAISYNASVYLKAYTRNNGELRMSDQSGNGVRVVFDLTAGTIGSPLAFGTGYTIGTSSITPVGNNWYRVSVSGTTNTATINSLEIYVANASLATSYVGNGSGFFAFGADLEALAFPTSYIATTSAQVTRASDIANMTGTNFSSWYNASQGTFYTEFIPIVTTGSSRAILQTNNYVMYLNASASLGIYDGTNAALNGTVTSNVLNKALTTYSSNKLMSCLNGSVPTTTNAYNNVFATATTLAISGNNLFNGWIKKVAFYPQAVTSTNAQALTGL